MFNPDYPTDNGGNFLMHTYQQPQQQTSMFWNGQSFGMLGGMSYMNDTSSRRNFNPVNPFQQFGQAQPAATNPFANNNNNGSIPEQFVQPFGTYPPATPNGNPMGLNALVDSRRNMNNPVQVSQNNPWATQQPAAPAAPVAPVAQMPQMPTNPCMNPYDPYGMGGFKIDMSTAALYNASSIPSFDKSNSWDNCYTKYRPLMSPNNIDWYGQYNGQQSSFMLQAPQPQAMQYPVQQYNVPQNWNDLAERNWTSVY
jgi:hypothetical protein